ncbi:MAG: hypothetical protein KC933_37855 [Myxococcales bacterium]|nr:hypothetical protein [Myxococcales bacterium]
MRVLSILRLTCLGLLTLAACTSTEEELVDAGTQPDDAGEVADAGTPDSGEPAACPALGQELQQGTGPTRRGDSAAAYDPACERVFMFFGDAAEPQNCNPAAAQFLGDGYTYDFRTGTWAAIEVQGEQRPLDRVRPSGAWDTTRNLFYVFGGRWRNGTAGAYTYLNDVWAFDPESRSWSVLWPLDQPGAPLPRMNTVMVYDEVGDRLLVFAGGRASGATFAVDSQTWAFDLDTKTWSQIAQGGSQPTPRLFHVSALDTKRNRLWVFGGGGVDSFTTADDFFNDLWSLDLATETWSKVPDAPTCRNDAACGGAPCVNGTCNTPATRIKGGLVYDEAGDRLVLFGGHDGTDLGNENDLWTFSIEGGSWSRVTAGDELNPVACTTDADCPSTRTCDTFRGICEQFGFCDFASDFATFDPMSPERRESQVFVGGGARAFMYGGRTDCGLVNDSWLLDYGTMQWMELTPTFSGLTCWRSGRQDCAEPDARKCG